MIETTRDKILFAMFHDIHRNGYQGLRADKVIADLSVTKGALYHYFSGKEAIGVAVIEEIIEPNYLKFYKELDVYDGNPIDFLQFHLKNLSRLASEQDITLGCPLNNLVQEMTAINDNFREKLEKVVVGITTSVTAALRRGQAKGSVRADIDAEAVAQFYYASLEGSYGAAKVHRSVEVFRNSLRQLSFYLDTLRGA